MDLTSLKPVTGGTFVSLHT